MNDLKKLAGLKKSLPYRGRGGISKLTGCCPRCGSYANYGYYYERFKSCKSCGFDRYFDRAFDTARSMAKRGQPISSFTLEAVLAYYDRVYGSSNEPTISLTQEPQI